MEQKQEKELTKLKEAQIVNAIYNPRPEKSVLRRLNRIVNKRKLQKRGRVSEGQLRDLEASMGNVLKDSSRNFQETVEACLKVHERVAKKALIRNHDSIFQDDEVRRQVSRYQGQYCLIPWVSIPFTLYVGLSNLQVWLLVSRVPQNKDSNIKNYYQQLLACNSVSSKFLEIIDLDVSRTHGSPAQKRSLKNILTAFSKRNCAVGYLQGMNFMAKLILNVIKDEEDSFWVFVYFVEVLLEPNYLNAMEGVVLDQSILKKIVKQRYPSFHFKMKDLGCSMSTFTFKWIVCIFAICPVKEELKKTIWDFFILGDRGVVIKTALIMIQEMNPLIQKFEDLSEVLKLFDKDLGTLFRDSWRDLSRKLNAYYFDWEIVEILRMYSTPTVQKQLRKERTKMSKPQEVPCQPGLLVCQKYLREVEVEPPEVLIIQQNRPLASRIDGFFSGQHSLWQSSLSKKREMQKSVRSEDRILLTRSPHTCPDSDFQTVRDGLIQKLLALDGEGSHQKHKKILEARKSSLKGEKNLLGKQTKPRSVKPRQELFEDGSLEDLDEEETKTVAKEVISRKGGLFKMEIQSNLGSEIDDDSEEETQEGDQNQQNELKDIKNQVNKQKSEYKIPRPHTINPSYRNTPESSNLSLTGVHKPKKQIQQNGRLIKETGMKQLRIQISGYPASNQ